MTRELTPATKLAIQRQHDGPWCVVCGNSMPQAVVDMGYQTHPKCDPHEVADPLLSVRFSTDRADRIVGSKVPGQSVNSDRATAPLDSTERHG